jgi:hypothetical protein
MLEERTSLKARFLFAQQLPPPPPPSAETKLLSPRSLTVSGKAELVQFEAELVQFDASKASPPQFFKESGGERWSFFPNSPRFLNQLLNPGIPRGPQTPAKPVKAEEEPEKIEKSERESSFLRGEVVPAVTPAPRNQERSVKVLSKPQLLHAPPKKEEKDAHRMQQLFQSSPPQSPSTYQKSRNERPMQGEADDAKARKERQKAKVAAFLVADSPRLVAAFLAQAVPSTSHVSNVHGTSLTSGAPLAQSASTQSTTLSPGPSPAFQPALAPPPHGTSSGEEETVTAARIQAEEKRVRMEAAQRAEKRVLEEEEARKKEKEAFWLKEEEEAAAVARLKEDLEAKRRRLESRRARALKEQEVLFCFNTTNHRDSHAFASDLL